MLSSEHLIEKRNILNEMRPRSITLQELRFFTIYLAKINARDVSTRIVRFKISDFKKIMDLNTLNLQQLRDNIDKLLLRVVEVPLEEGVFERFTLFKKCLFKYDDDGEGFVEIDAHDDALPLLFDFKERYFTYALWNTLSLGSTNQIRMYEILKQYEKIGSRIVHLKDLRGWLGIEESEYPRYGDFRTWVLDACKKALEDHTDIKFTYEPYGKKGKAGKILRLKFTISKNDKYVDKLSLADFIDMQEVSNIIDVDYEEDYEDEESADVFRETLLFLSDACNKEFDLFEMRLLYDLAIKIIPREVGAGKQYELDIYDYLKRKYNELEYRDSRNPIKKRFNYLKKLLTVDLGAKK